MAVIRSDEDILMYLGDVWPNHTQEERAEIPHQDRLPPGWGYSDEALRQRDRDRLDRITKEHTALVSSRKQTEALNKAIADFEDRQQRMDDRSQNRDLIRRLMSANQGFANTERGYQGPGNLRRRDDMYTGDELGRQIQRERHGGYPDSPRNCLCDGDCDECCYRRRRSKSISRSKRQYSSDQQQVNMIGPVYMDGYEPDSTILCYGDWPPVDIYKKRWGGLLPDKRLPWLSDDLLLDGNDVMRFSKRRRRGSSYLPRYSY